MDSATQTIGKAIRPTPGVYLDVRAEEYFAWDCCSKHRLDKIDEFSPLHCKHEIDNPSPPTEAMIVGSAFHDLVLLPEQFKKLYTVATQCAGTLKKGGKCSNNGKLLGADGKWYCGTHVPEALGEQPRGLLTTEQMDMVQYMRDAFYRHKTVAALLNAVDGNNEIAIVGEFNINFDGIDYPLLSKGRFDIARPSWAAIGDLKSTTCASKKSFEREACEYGYHRQAAMYLDLAQQHESTQSLKIFAIIANEKKPPYGVAAYAFTKDAIDAGRAQNERLQRTYAACERNNHWWGYASEFESISLPAYEMRKIFKEF